MTALRERSAFHSCLWTRAGLGRSAATAMPSVASRWLRPLRGVSEVDTRFSAQGVSSQYPHHGFPFPASTGPPRPYPQDPAPEPLPGSGSFHLTRSLARSHRCGCGSISISGPRLSPELQVVRCHLGERTPPSPGSPPRRRPHRPACKLLPLFSWPLFLVSHLLISGRSFPGFHRATS